MEVGSFEAVSNLGSFHHRRGNLELAEIAYEVWCENGGDVDLRELGQVRMKLGNLDGAEQIFLQAVDSASVPG